MKRPKSCGLRNATVHNNNFIFIGNVFLQSVRTHGNPDLTPTKYFGNFMSLRLV